MRAVTCTTPGGPEVLAISDVPAPQPGPDQLLVQIHSSALNRADLLQRRGLYPPPSGCTEIPGLECAGIVTDCGTNVDRGWIGQRVMALLCGGGHAEAVCIEPRVAVPLPECLSLSDAGGVAEAFMTAREALFEKGDLQPGQVVLVRSGASGVGSAAVQLAVACGARVFSSAGTAAKCAFVDQLGAECFDYRVRDVAEEIERRIGKAAVDVVVDTLGPRAWPEHERLLARGGRVVTLGLLAGAKPQAVDFGLLLRRELTIRGMVMRTRSAAQRVALTRRFIRDVLPLFVDGRVRPIVDSVYDLDQVRTAHERMERNENIGKIVLRIAR